MSAGTPDPRARDEAGAEEAPASRRPEEAVPGDGPGASASADPGLPAADDEAIEIDIAADGTVRIHARCLPGQDPAECAERVRFLVESLGIPQEGVVTEISEEPGDG